MPTIDSKTGTLKFHIWEEKSLRLTVGILDAVSRLDSTIPKATEILTRILNGELTPRGFGSEVIKSVHASGYVEHASVLQQTPAEDV